MLELQYNNFLCSNWINCEEYKSQYAKRWISSEFIKNYPTERSHMFRYIDKKTNKIYTNINDIAVTNGKIVEKSKYNLEIKLLNNLIIEKRMITVDKDLNDVYDQETNLKLLLNAKDILKIKQFETKYDTNTKIYTYQIKYTKEMK
jgi:hypothetical protein